MAIHELSFPSFNERDEIKSWLYVPVVPPKAVVQLVHGFGEHSRRYLHMILRLNEAGYVVCADDHVGHGKTAHDSNTWGDFGEKGYRTTTVDEHTLHGLVVKRFPGLPYFFFGHSWGSMIARNYAAEYGHELAGLTICGTCGIFAAAPPVQAELEVLVNAGRGKEVDASFMGRLFAGMTDRYDDVRTPNDWISADPNVVADHGRDPFNNLLNPCNVQSLYDLTVLIEKITGKTWAAKLPAKLPVYNIAGDHDPVGAYGEGVYAVSNWLYDTGHRHVTTRLYPGHRHEIHNDRDIRDEVVDGVIAFFDSVL